MLVVIAIIGILSAIVLAALGSARTNAKEASILSSLNSARTQAELYHVNNGSYSGLCSDSKIQEIVANASSTGDGAACWEADMDYSGSYQSGITMIDYGIGARLDDTYYEASPLGSGTMDDENAIHGNWASAKTVCADASKRLPSPSALRAMYDIESDTPEGFLEATLWSALESPSLATNAYITGMHDSGVSHIDKSNERYARCVH